MEKYYCDKCQKEAPEVRASYSSLWQKSYHLCKECEQDYLSQINKVWEKAEAEKERIDKKFNVASL